MQIKNNHKQIEVWADWHSLGGPHMVGKLTPTVNRGKEIFSFEYDKVWLTCTHAMALDPALKLYPGRQYPAGDETNFGVFLDSSPDRWGRTLIQRREILLARTGKRPEQRLFESDFLLGVFDLHRMGGLRFKYAYGPFLGDNKEHSTPPWSSIRELEAISLKLEEENLGFLKKERIGVVDMECAAFFAAASFIKRKAIAIFYVSDIIGKQPFYSILDSKEKIFLSRSIQKASRLLYNFIKDSLHLYL
mgnify:CR=1 FL=1